MAARITPRQARQERRGAPRAPERVQVVMTDVATELRAETHNLSASGAYCALDRFVAPMTKLQLQMELPTANSGRPATIHCYGVVVRTKPLVAPGERGRYHVAIFFTDLSTRDRATITRFVARRLVAHRSTG